jgi:hypothetical protein
MRAHRHIAWTRTDVANYAALVALDRASAMSGAIGNPTCGSLVD